MTPRHLTMAEAEELLETAFQISANPIATDTYGIVDEVVAGVNPVEARRVIEGYIHLIPGQIDPDTIEVTSDVLDEAPDMDACRIVIKTREWM